MNFSLHNHDSFTKKHILAGIFTKGPAKCRYSNFCLLICIVNYKMFAFLSEQPGIVEPFFTKYSRPVSRI